jgi:hypothetical protein
MVFVFEGKSTAELVIVLEVAHSLAGLDESLIVRNIDNCGAEGVFNVAYNLGVDFEDLSGFFLYNQGNFERAGRILGEIVEVEGVLLFVVFHFHFHFCFFFSLNCCV